MTRLLLPLVVASGFAGLAYEVVWTRMLAAVLGTEMLAVLGVVTGFFAGLGLGAWVLDGPIRRCGDVRRCYAWLELVIGAWSVVSVALLPLAAAAIRTALGVAPGPVASWAAGFVVPAVLLLPATACMGGTLIALERLVSEAVACPRVAAGVYGANTAGAMLGALGAVPVLLPWLGVSGTMLALAAVNVGCALAVFGVAPTALVGVAPAAPAGRPDPVSTGLDARLPMLLAGSGVLGIAFEVLVIRQAAQLLQDTVYTFAALLAAYLLGTALGGVAWQRGRIAPSAAVVGALLAGVSAAGLVTAWMLRAPWLLALRGAGADWTVELGVAALMFGLPAAAGGALFGCLAQAVRDRRGTLGQAVALNAAGAAFGPALAALVLIPTLGAASGLVAVSLAFLLLSPAPWRRTAWMGLVPAGLAAALLLVPGPPPVRVPLGGVVLALREGPSATVGVVEDAGGTRFLEVNGHFRMGGTSSRRSDWRQAQVPLLLHAGPERALFLGVGTGATLAGAAALPGVAATGVELVPEVVALLPWFTEPGTMPPPIVTADARRFVAADRGRYDVIVADLFHPALDGTGALYTTEHFAAVQARLAEGGLFCQWLPLYQLDDPSLAAIIRGFLTVFPHGTAWLAHYSLQTPMLALIGGREGVPDMGGVAARLADPGVRAATAPAGLAVPMDVLGLFVADAAGLAAYAGPGPSNTDDRPFVALDARRNVRALAAPPAERLLALLRGTAPARRDGDARLAAYWQARDRFIAAGAGVPVGASGHALIDAAVPGLLDAVRLSGEFDPAYGPLLGMARALLAPGRPAADRREGRALLQAINEAAPFRREAREMLARSQ